MEMVESIYLHYKNVLELKTSNFTTSSIGIPAAYPRDADPANAGWALSNERTVPY